MEVAQAPLCPVRSTGRRKQLPFPVSMSGWHGLREVVAGCGEGGAGSRLSPGPTGHVSECGLGAGWGDAVKTPVDRGAVRDKATPIWNQTFS